MGEMRQLKAFNFNSLRSIGAIIYNPKSSSFQHSVADFYLAGKGIKEQGHELQQLSLLRTGCLLGPVFIHFFFPLRTLFTLAGFFDGFRNQLQQSLLVNRFVEK